MEQICEYDLCTGCSACQNICPHGAIVLLPDKNGELHPQINTQICVDCGICQSRCPVNDNVRMVMPVSCYAAWNSDAKERELSASGGIAAAMYKYVIEQLAGVVYGVAWNSVLRPEYVRVDSLADLERLKGSKYVQAFVDNIYQDVKKDLQHGRWVLFVGTPCQVAGLQNYLGKNKSNDRLLTCDLLCHGVPPYDYLKAELGTIPSPVLKKVINCRFRGNDQYNYCFSLWDDGKRLLYSRRGRASFYLYAFLTSITLRESCYTCRYASSQRISDMTIGDFLGLGQLEKVSVNPANVSVVTINSGKGDGLWRDVLAATPALCCEERDYAEAVAGGGSFRTPAMKNPKRETFISYYRRFGWRVAIVRVLWKSIVWNRLKLKMRK